MLVSRRTSNGRQTYGIACVSVAGDLALATADVDAGVLLGVAPCLPVVLGNGVDGDGAAGNDSVTAVVALGSGKASKGRDGDDDGGVEHGELLYVAKSINA